MVSWDVCGCWVESSTPDATAVVAGWMVNSCGCTLWAAPAVTALWGNDLGLPARSGGDCQPWGSDVGLPAGSGGDCQLWGSGLGLPAGSGGDCRLWGSGLGLPAGSGRGCRLWGSSLGLPVGSGGDFPCIGCRVWWGEVWVEAGGCPYCDCWLLDSELWL